MFDDVSETRSCMHCAHWSGDWSRKIYARTPQGLEWVGQCLNQEDEEAPFADVPAGEAYVFTTSTSVCPAFRLHPDSEADMAAETALRRDVSVYGRTASM